MSWQILQRWFNVAPDGVHQYFTANHNQKFWFEWVEDFAPNFFLHVSYYGKGIGKVEAAPTKDGGLELADIIILDRRLRGHGVGSEMMKCLIQEARRQNIRYIRGVISPDPYTTTDQLIKFYKKHGFHLPENRAENRYILLMLNG